MLLAVFLLMLDVQMPTSFNAVATTGRFGAGWRRHRLTSVSHCTGGWYSSVQSLECVMLILDVGGGWTS